MSLAAHIRKHGLTIEEMAALAHKLREDGLTTDIIGATAELVARQTLPGFVPAPAGTRAYDGMIGNQRVQVKGKAKVTSGAYIGIKEKAHDPEMLYHISYFDAAERLKTLPLISFKDVPAARANDQLRFYFRDFAPEAIAS